MATLWKLGDIPYDELVRLVANHLIVQQFKFHSHFRKQGQSVANFVAELRQLSEHCDFGTVLDDMLHDRLVCSINNDAIQHRLLGETPPLTFKKALEISIAVHQVKITLGDHTMQMIANVKMLFAMRVVKRDAKSAVV